MNKLIKEALIQHEEINKTVSFYVKLPDTISNKDVEDMREFLDISITEHFKFEEKEIFPALLEKGSEKEKQLIQTLGDQHKEILATLVKYKKNLFDNFEQQSQEEKKHSFMSIAENLLEVIITHAALEDKELFPAFIKYVPEK